jgi:hypothetical protein
MADGWHFSQFKTQNFTNHSGHRSLVLDRTIGYWLTTSAFFFWLSGDFRAESSTGSP